MMTRAEFAKILGVSAETVRRWEDCKIEPKPIYQQFIQAYCVKHAVEIQMTPANIRAIRKGNGLTQEEFAKALGVGKSSVADWEMGRQQPQKSAQKKIYAFYKAHKGD